jgi:peptidoglycan hydrolase-like protein with peptidoglycan-binding domain
MRLRTIVAAVGLVSGAAHVMDAAGELRAFRDPQAQATESSTRVGDRGAAVTSWQSSLNDWRAQSPADLGPIAVDGVFGPETEVATRDFQDASAEVPTDLVVDDEDRAALAAALD